MNWLKYQIRKKTHLQIFQRLARIELLALLAQLSIQTVMCCDASLRMHLKLQRLFFFLHNVVLYPETRVFYYNALFSCLGAGITLPDGPCTEQVTKKV